MPLPTKDYLTADEERALAERIKQGDIDARNELVERNIGLAGQYAGRCLGRGVDRDDLAQEANLGLIRAAETHDPDKGRFTTYATWWIRRYVLEALKRRHVVHVPDYVQRVMAETEPGIRQFQESLDPGKAFSETVIDHRPTETPQGLEEQNAIDKAMEILTARERSILSGRFGLDREPMTLRELGYQHGITHERVRQIQEKSFIKLREFLDL
jgi:RNA polymerase primary sigma factor